MSTQSEARTTALYLAQNVLQSRNEDRQGVTVGREYSAQELVDESKIIESYILGN
jgi:hypothetical protein